MSQKHTKNVSKTYQKRVKNMSRMYWNMSRTSWKRSGCKTSVPRTVQSRAKNVMDHVKDELEKVRMQNWCAKDGPKSGHFPAHFRYSNGPKTCWNCPVRLDEKAYRTVQGRVGHYVKININVSETGRKMTVHPDPGRAGNGLETGRLVSLGRL